jgi:ubiquinone/menaquinone biosynthesis C-methylase UbiE
MYSGNSYKNFPELYDLLYERYLKSVPDFVALVKTNTPRGGAILDLAAGTGEVTIPLLKSGFKVTSLDASRGMLRELESKARKLGIKNSRAVTLDMRKLNYREKFDSVCIRQAVNYFIGIKSLEAGLKKILASLKAGSKLIFNAPNYQGKKVYPVVASYYKKGVQVAFVVEVNKIQGRLMKHRQYSIVWEDKKEPRFITDENSFYLFTKKEFERALRICGFSKISFKGSAKTLYCVATK